MSQQRNAVIDVKDLVMVYPGGTRAVDGIDFAVHEGEFFGFLGPNGAGKSTALKILSTLLKKTSGNVTVAGYDVDHRGGDRFGAVLASRCRRPVSMTSPRRTIS